MKGEEEVSGRAAGLFILYYVQDNYFAKEAEYASS